MSDKRERLDGFLADEAQSPDMEVSIEDHDLHVMSRSRPARVSSTVSTQSQAHAFKSTESIVPEVESISSRSSQGSTSSSRQAGNNSISQVAYASNNAPSIPQPKVVDAADQIKTRAKADGTRPLWVGKPRRNYFVIGVIGALLAVAVVAVLWYLEYVVFKKPIDNSSLVYSSCGDCNCIPDSEDLSCPTQPKSEDTNSIFVNLQLSSMTLLNPSTILCDPYILDETGELYYTSCVEKEEGIMWDDSSSVCAFVYDLSSNTTNDGCPTAYGAWTFPDEDTAIVEGGVVTHSGACGVCSTAQDLAAYISNPNMADSGQRCTSRGIIDSLDGIVCFAELGLTEECAKIWSYTLSHTNDKCLSICLPILAEQQPNNGPAPTCALNDCLQCHEDMSGAVFAKLAGRTQQNSGLRSTVVRPCSSVTPINHAANLLCSPN